MEDLVVVIGANGNIGSAISLYELGQSRKVVSIDKEFSSSAEGTDKNITYICADCKEPKILEDIFSKLFPYANYRIRSLVLAAALDSVPYSSIEGLTDYNSGVQYQDFKDISDRILVNVTSQIWMIRIFYKYFYELTHVTLFSSIYGVVSPDHRIYADGFIKPIEYSASKSSIIGIAKHLAVTMASDQLGRCNCLVLGGLESFSHDTHFVQKYINKVPMSRMANLSDVINAYKFLISVNSSYITGTSLTVDGGYTLI